jgi:hypothetical protein
VAKITTKEQLLALEDGEFSEDYKGLRSTSEDTMLRVFRVISYYTNSSLFASTRAEALEKAMRIDGNHFIFSQNERNGKTMGLHNQFKGDFKKKQMLWLDSKHKKNPSSKEDISR